MIATHFHNSTLNKHGVDVVTDNGTRFGIACPDERTARTLAAGANLAAKLADLIQYLGQDWDGDSMVEECKQALQEAGQPFEYEVHEDDEEA